MNKGQSIIKVLNVFGRMDRGGAETGALQFLRRVDKTQFQYDFLTLKKGKGYFDNEIEKLGSKVYHVTYSSNPFIFYKKFKEFINQYGPFDIIHSRVHHYSGLILFYAKLLGIPIRIAHSHSATPPQTGFSKFMKPLYFRLTEYLIKKYATAGLAVSKIAAESLFGKNWEVNPKFHVIYTGIDLTPFERHNETNLREILRIPKDAIVIGHVGSFRPAKNHAFLLRVFKELYGFDNRFYLLLAGKGPLEKQIKELSVKLNINKNVQFLGFREDIEALMLDVMDIFVLPSLYEGLPHVGVEAQAAGLPCIFSNRITREIDLIHSQTKFLPIDKGVKVWAKYILDLMKMNKIKKQVTSYKKIIGSNFDVNIGVKLLSNFYKDAYENSFRA